MSSDGPLDIFRLSRRNALIAAAAILAAPRIGCAASPMSGPIVSLDYGLASTLLALGVTPAAIVSLTDWDKWVVEPKMPSGVVDLGTAWEINLEILASLKPALILTTPYLAALKPRLEPIAPVLELTIYAEGGEALPRAIEATRTLATAIGREPQAADFLARSEQFFDDCARRVQRMSPSPLALVSFVDQHHARIYGGAGLYQNVMTRIGLKNAWTGSGNFWGFETIGFEQLASLDQNLRLIVFEPLIPPNILSGLEESPLWTSLPFVKAGRISVLPGSLMFGMVQEAERFARILLDHLEKAA
ncbi:iron-siderophore ABC transporter substrate-binding protein [Rhizobium rhizogenes]|uniref:iron-siderophore ABC transporter substrate-binding protein n=1 Tax=Rhizobium rhizogenes TaxID=359 RepID=UPI00055E5B5F|nr:iron-siderophore ABC transporter substrate-binding protein [Rhizobium rhizogenes]MDJ1635537.1 iron-siderophore ABC transporter substrate-binding protein [Rhizobium rhizogenes]NTF84092.1 iron-siderophore ABC transporter substrate-binding protein [Rhizobium rhizogenes]NTG03425.1 iron-siderophore ABC transporter substrate-binding protein [Rhizobium rhizogenes]NTG76494.1 iron-siderophore ABC transporter substrate-binding protein [Rhizobium rhizogenes]NTH15159.1 iron-siderophore ABC transporter 